MAGAESSPRTFSITTHSGRSVSMASAMCAQSPERVPGLRPVILPTVDTSWHGNPPQRMSTGGTVFQSMVVMSPRLGASGQWWEKTRATGSLISENQIVFAPKTSSAAKSSPP